jgi:hypothetical protein
VIVRAEACPLGIFQLASRETRYRLVPATNRLPLLLTEERRKVWQQVDGLIQQYLKAKSRNQSGVNPAAKQELKHVREQFRKMMLPSSELSAVAKWCVLFRNDRQLSKLVG